MVRSQPTKEQYNTIIEQYKSKNETPEKKAILYFFYNKYYGLRKGLFPLGRNNKEIDIEKFNTFFDWISKTEFTNEDYTKVLAKYKQNKNAFIFLDPPYFDSFNNYYMSYNDGFKDSVIVDNTVMYIDILNFIKNTKNKTMLIINKNAITDHIYGNYTVGIYDKVYQMTKKKTQHIIVCNYK